MSITLSMGSIATSTTDNNVDMNVLDQSKLTRVSQTFPNPQTSRTVYNYVSGDSLYVPSLSCQVTRAKYKIDYEHRFEVPTLVTDSVAGTVTPGPTPSVGTIKFSVPLGMSPDQVMDLMLTTFSLLWASVAAGVPDTGYIERALVGGSDTIGS